LIFNSLAFFVFFPIVVALVFLARPRFRWVVLLGASWFFYGWWRPEYLALLLVSTSVDYTVGRLLGREDRPVRRKLYLGVSLAVNLGMLFFFKYLHFVSGGRFDVVLPVGISFYTFQTIGYGIDVYRRKYEPERHFGRFALFVAFFPHLVAGPIMRAPALLPQFREPKRWDTDRVLNGLGFMAWGLFKKVVIADRAAHFVDAVYSDPTRFQGATVLLATYLFAFQIYCDFSGYSDIAFGAARVLGFELIPNFNRPYVAATIPEFWRRWHVSLSTWFFDYVYVPLGGNRVGHARLLVNVAVVFLLSGLWHGANWTFLLWGAFHGGLMIATLAALRAARPIAERFVLGNVTRAIGRACGTVLTFHLVCLGWLIFRASDVAHVKTLLSRLPIDMPRSALHELTHVGPAPPDVLAVDLGVLAASIVALEVVEWLLRTPHASRTPAPIRWVAWAALCVWLVLASVQTHTPFLYFQF
jgi:D-alanyl-lipoteichoic acid acyltransferase DltB (MBOAT superfamily)